MARFISMICMVGALLGLLVQFCAADNTVVCIEVENGNPSQLSDWSRVTDDGRVSLKYTGEQSYGMTIDDITTTTPMAYAITVPVTGQWLFACDTKQKGGVATDQGNDVWFRMDMSSGNSVLGKPWTTWHKLYKQGTQFSWATNYKDHDAHNVKMQLSSGPNKIWLAGRSPGFVLDRCMLVRGLDKVGSESAMSAHWVKCGSNPMPSPPPGPRPHATPAPPAGFKYRLLGDGCCRTADGGSGTATKFPSLDSLEACQNRCDATSECVAIETNFQSDEGCEVHTTEITSAELVNGAGCKCYIKEDTNLGMGSSVLQINERDSTSHTGRHKKRPSLPRSFLASSLLDLTVGSEPAKQRFADDEL